MEAEVQASEARLTESVADVPPDAVAGELKAAAELLADVESELDMVSCALLS